MRSYYVKNVVSLSYDTARCKGCGRCVEVCPQQVFEMEGRRAVMADRDRCIECGACAGNCPAGALSVQAGVGCASAILVSMLTGKEPTCGCGSDAGGSGCC
ncbi:MAG: 4Fe-4S binding protein [Clostridiaceae bacterium]|jgi:NAD-dependent dihydropyrimidine dehydrogenase PreA subunit|nr:4Fe-4S binding protein [Clostridiaceae bacterium]